MRRLRTTDFTAARAAENPAAGVVRGVRGQGRKAR